jgi:hypothetical protein
MCRSRVLIVHELWWPRGIGGVLTTHLMTKMLAKRDFGVRVVTGVRDYEAIDDVELIYEPRLKTSNKLELWLNIYLLSRESWFRRLIEWADIIYIPRYTYSLILLAKVLKEGYYPPSRLSISIVHSCHISQCPTMPKVCNSHLKYCGT